MPVLELSHEPVVLCPGIIALISKDGGLLLSGDTGFLDRG